MNKRLLSLFLVLVMVSALFPTMSISANAADARINDFLSDSRWKHGASYAYNQSPKLASFSSAGCCAYCADYVKYCYGYDNPRTGSVFYDTSEIRAGDVLTVGNQSDGTGHWFICVERNGNRLYVAEGNVNNKVRVGWNYTISGSRSFSEDSRSFTAGYHYLDAPDPIANLGDDFYAVILNKACWKPISQNTDTEKITLETEIGSAKQKWHFVRQTDGSYAIFSCYDGKALEMTDGIRDVSTQLTARNYWEGAYQRWFLIPQDGGYIIQSRHYRDENWVMDLYGAYSNDGNIIQINHRNNSTAQVWSIYVGEDIQLHATTVKAAINAPSVTFSWDRVYGVAHYNLKIWKDELWKGDAYHLEMDTASGVTVNLPAGTYYAYVDSCDYFQFFASNVVELKIPEKKYTVSFNANGGEVSPSSVQVVYGNQYGTLPVPTRSGYEFAGWYTEAINGTKITSSTTVTLTNNHTLYARWNNLCINGHSYTYSATKVPTTADTGLLTGTCIHCGEKTTVTLPKLNTTDYTYSVTKAAACTAEGTGRYTWKTMNYGTFFFNVTIPKTAHSYKDTVTAPTCTTTGYTTHTCSVCGESYVDSYTNAPGHDYVEGICTRCGALAPQGGDNPFRFDDVQDDVKFYFDPVYWAYGADPQITNGIDETHFGPDNACTRGHVVSFLWRAAGCPEPKNVQTPFKDLKKGAFYEKAVAWAVENEITNGLSADKFGPDAQCNRGQIVTFLWRFRGEEEPKIAETPFTDLKKGAFYEKAVAWAVENEVTNGMTATTFVPDATCTRGQVVTFLYRAMDK